MELNKATAKLGHITSTTLFILSLLPYFNIYLQEGKSFCFKPPGNKPHTGCWVILFLFKCVQALKNVIEIYICQGDIMT